MILSLKVPNPLLGKLVKRVTERDFPGGAVVKNPPAKAGDTGSILSPGRFHMLWGS